MFLSRNGISIGLLNQTLIKLNMDILLAIAMVFLTLIIFLILWKSADWFDQIINE